LFANYESNLLGRDGNVYINAMVRLHGGAAAIPAFKDDLARVSGRTDIEIWDQADLRDDIEQSLGFEADALVAFAVAAAVAAVFLVGQAIARLSAATVADLRVLRALGLTGRQTRLAAVGGPALAAVIGTVIGAIGAAVASRWFPIGSAALGEPAPGFDVDWAVLGPALIAVPVLIAGGALAAATMALRAGRVAEARRGPTVASTLTRARLPVPVAVGAGFALEPGRGGHQVPVRSALLGAVIGVIGVIGVFTFSSGIDDAAAHPERFGQTYQLQAFFGLNGQDFGPADDVLEIVADDPDVVAVNDSKDAVADFAGGTTSVTSYDPVGGALDLVVTEGRAPAAGDEVALAPATARAMDAGVGDTVELVGTESTRELTVSGIAFVSPNPHSGYADGSWVTGETFDDLFDGFKFHLAEVAVRPGADPAAVAARIQDRVAAELPEAAGFELGPPAFPIIEVAELRQVRRLPLFLAGFLTVLALGAVGHALATAVRRRRHDVAVLRALGVTRRQSRAVVVVQATVLALVGLAVGVPLGIALGRTLWQEVADSTPLFYVAPVAVWALVLIVPLALMAANILAVFPARRAASLRVSQVLRVE
jgi:ABC-type lipoprotein release transport system permease subunit